MINSVQESCKNDVPLIPAAFDSTDTHALLLFLLKALKELSFNELF